MWATGRIRAARAPRGLTLIEMLVVVAVLAVLALPLTLRLGAGGLWTLPPPPLDTAARRLITDIEAARDRALLARQAVALEPGPDGWALDGTPTLFDGVAMDWRPADQPLRFLPDRRGTPFQVVLRAGARTRSCAFDGWDQVLCDAPG